MTNTPDPSAIKQKETIRPLEDLLTDFAISEWVETPSYVTELPETTPDSNIREMTEQEYRDSTTPTKWHRYLTLGRYVTDGFTFDASIDEMLTDPLKVHCMIWYQYTYHLDHKLNIPMKLLEWASHCSLVYLRNFSASALNLSTKKVTWKQFSRSQSLTDSWSEVPAKSKKQDKKKPKKSSPSKSISGHRNPPATIIEETSETSTGSANNTSVSGKQPSDSDASAASDGKMSVLAPNLNVPVCDGTYRVTFRLKVTPDQMSKYRDTSTIKDEIYAFLNEVLKDDHGSLYNWNHNGTDQLNSISKMTPTQVRQFICPSISIMPSLSLVVVPIRFGFVDQLPSKWRNTELTKATLAKFNATVSFSNSTTTSGKLVAAGYILLKAPMTTHRLRYLQSLRKMLPENTPPFDILLHKRTPTHQLMPHLVVQCGESHVHSLSESLATILTGTQSALYIPRFVFEKMSDAEASSLFESHDSFVKSLNWLPLFPLLSNLDRVRKEHNSDGTVTERTTREWARNIKTIDGSAYAQCDVVNGGDDQRCYLLFPPKDKEAAQQALDAYRRRLYPFTQREAKFREEVGPPPVVHLSKRVIANLDFIKKLSSLDSKGAEKPDAETDSKNENSTQTGSSVSSVSQATRPPTPGEYLRKRYRDIDKTHEESLASDNSSTSTTDSTVSEATKVTTGRLSVSSAKFREFDAILLRQKQDSDQAAAKASERISTIERQLHRFNDLDQKLSDLQKDISCRFNLFEDRLLETMKEHIGQSGSNQSTMESRIEKLMSVVVGLMDQKLPTTDNDDQDTNEVVTDNLVCTAQDAETTNSQRSDSLVSSGSGSRSSEGSRLSGSSLGTASMDAESTGNIQSPEHKRHRSSRKKKSRLPESIRRHLDHQRFSQLHQNNDHAAHNCESSAAASSASPPSLPQSPTRLTTTADDDLLLTPRSPTPPPDTTDPESQYKEKSPPSTDAEHLLTTGTISHRRGSLG